MNTQNYFDLMDISLETEVAAQSLKKISHFLPAHQIQYLSQLRHQKEIQEMISDLEATISNMPVTYQTDGMGDTAIAHLHYFTANGDWYITEKDKDGGVVQAFGLASIANSYPEIGYISIQELVSLGAQLDLNWTAKTLSEIKQIEYAA